MDDFLSAAARRSLALAWRYARGRAAPAVAPADLWAGLLADEENRAAAMIRRAGGDPAVLIGVVDRPSPPPQTASDELPGDPLVQQVLARARQLAVFARPYDRIGSEELLAALLELWDESRGHLEQCGIDRQALLDRYYEERQPPQVELDPAEIDWSVRGPDETIDLARLVDANGNRLREALRVLEDYARFVRDDEEATAQLKECRHLLRGALEFVPDEWRLRARQIDHDVGTSISSPDEHSRRDLAAVAAANWKRAQESLRTLEECAKVESPRAARQLENLRYRLYGLEARLAGVAGARGRLAGIVLYWILDPAACVRSLDWMVERALEGGVQVVQLRDKSATDRTLFETAQKVRRWTARRGALFVVNDRPDIARLVGADGVHVGQEELPVPAARRLLGPDRLVGLSTHSIEQAREAVRDGADYIGVGPCFSSRTKSFDAFPGIEYVRQIGERFPLPAFCVGGIDSTNLPQILEAGGTRIAVAGALSGSPDPCPVARDLHALLEGRQT